MEEHINVRPANEEHLLSGIHKAKQRHRDFDQRSRRPRANSPVTMARNKNLIHKSGKKKRSKNPALRSSPRHPPTREEQQARREAMERKEDPSFDAEDTSFHDEHSDLENEQPRRQRPRKTVNQYEEELAAMKERAEKAEEKAKLVTTLPGKVNDELLQLVRANCKDVQFRTRKFAADDAQLDAATRKTFESLEMTKEWAKETIDDCVLGYRRNWHVALCEKRNYVQNQLREAALAWMKENDGDLPTSEEILDCSTRKVAMDNERAFKIFAWYWDVLLGKANGIAGWGDDTKYFVRISDAKWPDDKTKKLFTASTEAFICLVWANCEAKWKAVHAYRAEHNWENPPQRTSKNKHEEWHQSMFTDQDGGQKPFGGWHPNALKLFKKYQDAVKLAKKDHGKEWIPEMEGKMLAHLRQQHAISDGKPKSKKRKKTSQAEFAGIPDTVDSSDEEE